MIFSIYLSLFFYDIYFLIYETSSTCIWYLFSHPRTKDKGKEILTFNNSVDWTAFLAEATVDTFCHINIIAGGSSASVFSFFGLDCDGKSGADCLA